MDLGLAGRLGYLSANDAERLTLNPAVGIDEENENRRWTQINADFIVEGGSPTKVIQRLPQFLLIRVHLSPFVVSTVPFRLTGETKRTFSCLHGLVRAVERESGKLSKVLALFTSALFLTLGRLINSPAVL